MNTNVPAITVTNLTKKFGDFTAVDKISFEAKRGEIFGFLGPNGAGKSTTFRLICALLRPTSGRILIDGIDAFVDGGPATGKHVKGNLLLAGTDRVAMDAVGVAALKTLGSNQTIMHSRIFDHAQIARAAEIGLGASSPGDIELITADDQSREYGGRIADILSNG